MYCSIQNVRDASELLESETILLDEKIGPVIQKAQGRIDSVLKSRYIVPLSEPIPLIILSIAQDMAAGFLLANVFSNQLGQEQINLSNQFLKRADNDLDQVMADQQLDGLPGIRLAVQPGSASAPAISSTSMRPSPIDRIIHEW
ncbi:MAG TPA: phage protein Gp36 family protein [Syntrophomonadaceae bacterium]|nr:phage protein Gp36 family protein [Syntrophomonadaceae bacterium]